MEKELIVALIGAGSALIGAIFSTVSICLSNKNSKQIQFLENSKKVKTDIADERYEIYKKIIGYINSWYDCKPDYSFDYHTCPGIKNLEMSFVEQRLKNREDIEKEIETINKLSINYFYLDGKTYKLLKALENYLFNVLNYLSVRDVENVNFLYYVVYGDLWKYLFKMSKSVNKFIKGNDVLKFTQSKSVRKNYITKLYKHTNFYVLYGYALEIEELENILKESFNSEELKELKIKVKQVTGENSENYKTAIEIEKDVKKMQKIINKRKKNKKIFNSKIYKLKKACEQCKNKKCAFSKSNNISDNKAEPNYEI